MNRLPVVETNGLEGSDENSLTEHEQAKAELRDRVNHSPARLIPGWYPLSLAKKITDRPRSFLLSRRPYVAYRSEDRYVVLLDRCPHRNVPLSAGRVIGDQLECPYHGWRFGPDGQCTKIPGRLDPPKTTHRVESLPTRVHQGILFVGVDVEEQSEPFCIPEQTDDRYHHLVRQVNFPASLFGVVENALDVPHTSILHRGLFRTDKRNRVTVDVRRYDSHIEAQYHGEPPPSGLMGKVLSSGAAIETKVEHFDRFFLPGVLQVEYRLGPKAHFIITGYLRPIDEGSTELFAQVCVRTPLFGWLGRLLLLAVEPFARWIFRQDVRVLRLQTDNLRRFSGPRFMSTEVDVMYTGLTRLLKEGSLAEKGISSGPAGLVESLRENTRFEMET